MSDLIKCDGYDDCILGIMERFGQGPCLAYDKDKMIQKLEKDMTHQQALEFFDFNIVGAWVGVATPAFISKTDWDFFIENDLSID